MKIDFKFVPSKINTKSNLDKLYTLYIYQNGGTAIDHIFAKLFNFKNYNFKDLNIVKKKRK